ncbi:MAG: proline dehydrogenase family protein [Candidatus Marsarchaeota archaeon]|jgi:proline dehydrogenase|nr:proline dehydrogenase family protein [Candidatus Marsarchaeota archaeon]
MNFINNILEKLIAGRWIAGSNIDDVLEEAKAINKHNISAILNYLGEDITDENKIAETINVYKDLIDKIYEKRINADISIKPTQIGARINNTFLEKNYLYLIKYANSKNVFVWLDMEDHDVVDSTIKLYKKGLKYTNNIGICIQSNLKRSINDLNHLPRNSIIRIVKGAYAVDDKIGYNSKAKVNNNYKLLIKYLFENMGRFVVATHDIKMIEYAKSLNKKYKKNVSYAFLKGIMNEYAKELANSKKVSMYVPFGDQWIQYSYRRMREAGHISLILKSLMRNQKI